MRTAGGLEILDPGLLATVQDTGRHGCGGLGVAPAGAADPYALRVANELLGNEPGAAAIEITGGPLRLVLGDRCSLAVAGGEAAWRGGRVGPAAAVALDAGMEITVIAAPGLRAVLALPGGIDVPLVLGSRSTDQRGTFGGIEGRALVPGDRLGILADPGDLVRHDALWPAPLPDPRAPIRVVDGPHGAALGREAVEALAGTGWVVAGTSDRMGLRLDGPPVTRAATGELPSLPVVPGAIQVPPDGRPIVLLADAQPTGGYPVIAVVASVDRARLGQLRPGDRVVFQWVDAREAVALHEARESTFNAARAHLREAAAWDDLWRGAGG